MSYAEIGQKMGIARSTAYKLVRAEFKRLRKEQNEAAEEVLRLAQARLDHYLLKLEGQIEKGDRGAIEAAVKILQTQIRLVGADAPTRSETTLNVGGMSEAELVQEAKRLGIPVYSEEAKCP